MIAGAIAGSATVLITNPIWVVNTRMTARKSESSEDGGKAKAPSTIGTFIKICKEEGFSRLFAGVMPALVLVINPILQYTIYEQLKNILEKKRRATPTDSFYLGALGKLLATTITYPYITVKSRMHVAGKEGPKEDMVSSFRRILKEEGWSGLYGGKQFCCSGQMRFKMLTVRKVLDQRSPRVSSQRRSSSPSRMPCTKQRLRAAAPLQTRHKLSLWIDYHHGVARHAASTSRFGRF